MKVRVYHNIVIDTVDNFAGFEGEEVAITISNDGSLLIVQDGLQRIFSYGKWEYVHAYR